MTLWVTVCVIVIELLALVLKSACAFTAVLICSRYKSSSKKEDCGAEKTGKVLKFEPMQEKVVHFHFKENHLEC